MTGLPASAVGMGYNADRPRCRIEGQEILGEKTSINA
jgi:hypothetical protein